MLIHGTSISLFQATRSAVGKGHPELKDDDPIPIRPGADIYISPSHLQSRNDLSRTTTRRQSAREYLSSHIALPSAGAARPAAYRSQLDLALERSNSRRTSAREYLERTRTISPEDYDASIRRQESHDDDDDPKVNQLSLPSRTRSRTRSPTAPARRRSSNSVSNTNSLEPVSSETPHHVRENSGNSASGNSNRASRIDWIRRGRLARGKPVSDNDDDDADGSASLATGERSGDASNRV